MKTIVITIFLILSTLIDLRKKEVNISLCISVALVGLIYEIFISKTDILSIILGILPGIFLMLTSIVTNEEIGKGDAAILSTIGIFLGLKKTILVLIYALFSTIIIGGILLLIRKKNKKYKIPFVPFILFSYIALCI
ncbi:prepilin peptidase [Bovifimicola ammoniilytica]|uniref:prepilin peptidase n=1 Tax=Bovifimicola ammoniilytica TaxID=2981720 RepID=UPI00033F724A|nr:prepilin peptidase [Bovifimicola ammoniilytica]MCU6754184.1 prepilin peptidase [Bovifimicola ammoniilytica]CCZ05040.1 type IV leader peptidase family [Eubacterium sp. CAG:603]SCJ81528.1 Type IV leader peptidase family [uncultured Eubacterium sp.]